MNRVIDIIILRPGRAFAILLLICAPLLWAATRLSLRSGAESLLEGDPRSRFTYQLVGQSLSDTAVLVVVQTSPDTFTRESLGKLRDVSDAFSALPGVRDVKSFTHSSIPVRNGLSMEMQPYLPAEWTDENLAKVRALSLDHPLVRNLLVSPDARHTVLLVTFHDAAAHPLRADIEVMLKRFTDAQHTYQIVSRPLVEAEVSERAVSDLRILIPAVSLCVLLSLALYFRSVRLIVFLIVNLAAHSLLSAGVCALIPLDSGVYLVALLPLLAAFQLMLLILLASDFRDRFRECGDAAAAIRVSVTALFRSSHYAALTTAAGFLGLLAMPGASNHSFGLLGAICTMLGFVLLFTLGPITLIVLHRKAEVLSAQSSVLSGASSEHLALGTAHFSPSRIATILTAIVLLLGLVALPKLRPNLNLVDFLPADSPTRSIAHFFDREFAGMYFLRLDLDSGRVNGVPEGSFLRYVQQVEAVANAQPAVTAVYSHASVIAMINQVWSGWAPGSFSLPESALQLALFHTTLVTAGLPMTQSLADPEWRTARLYIRTRILPSADYIALHDTILAEARRLAPPGITAQPAPGLRDFLEADRALVRGQIISAIVSLIAIGLCLVFLWRSVKLTLATLFCICLPMASALGLAAIFGVTLNSITVMAATIVLGVAVDAAVHIITRWQELSATGLTPAQAVAATLHEKRGPTLLTTLVLLAVFIPLSFSAFPPVSGFAIVSALSFAGSQACILLVLPWVLVWKRRG